MKNLELFTLAFLTLLIAGWGCTATRTTASKYVGNWDYVVKNLPDGDLRGIMVISQVGDEYQGDLRSDATSISISLEDLKIENDKLTGYFLFQGMKINMSGTFDGSDYTGSIMADYNQFPMTARKVE